MTGQPDHLTDPSGNNEALDAAAQVVADILKLLPERLTELGLDPALAEEVNLLPAREVGSAANLSQKRPPTSPANRVAHPPTERA